MLLYYLVKELSSTYGTIVVSQVDGFGLQPGTSVQNLTDLYTVASSLVQLDLISWRLTDGLTTYTIMPSQSIMSEYVCRGSNDFGSRQASITIIVQGTYFIYNAPKANKEGVGSHNKGC